MIIKDLENINNEKILLFKECNNKSKQRMRKMKRFKRATEEVTQYFQEILLT